MSVLPQPLDDAGNRARLARIHGCAADYDDARARFHRRRGERELTKTEFAAVGAGEKTEQAQFARLGHAIMFAFDQTADAGHT